MVPSKLGEEKIFFLEDKSQSMQNAKFLEPNFIRLHRLDSLILIGAAQTVYGF